MKIGERERVGGVKVKVGERGRGKSEDGREREGLK